MLQIDEIKENIINNEETQSEIDQTKVGWDMPVAAEDDLVPHKEYELQINIKCKGSSNGGLHMIRCNEAGIFAVDKEADDEGNIIRDTTFVGYIPANVIDRYMGIGYEPYVERKLEQGMTVEEAATQWVEAVME